VVLFKVTPLLQEKKTFLGRRSFQRLIGSFVDGSGVVNLAAACLPLNPANPYLENEANE
jgi:hypothetical protein